MKRIIALTIAGIMSAACLALTGCQKNEGTEQEETKQVASVIKNKYIVQEGITDYYLVIPKDAMEEEQFAALEFNYFMQMATGCSFETITESEVKSNYKYISFGQTEQLEENVDVDLSRLDGTNSAYFITTKGNNIYVASSDSYRGDGCLYGTYDLLHDLVGYTYYHNTEIYVEEKRTVNLLEYDNFFVFPSLDIRCVSTAYNYSNDTHNTRLRFMNFSRGWEFNDESFGHGMIQTYLDPTDIAPDSGGKTWGQLHPDWFMYPDVGDINPNVTEMIQNQLCMTAYETGLDEVIAERLIEFVSEDEEAKYFMFGSEDNHLWCDCTRCREALAEWGGTNCGLQIRFMNKVIERVEKWLAENQPGREIEYIIYAYHSTTDAPVREENGEYVPYSDKVLPHDKLRVMLCPISSNFAYTFDSPVNGDFRRALEGWSKVASGKLYIYSYDLNMYHYFLHFNNYGTAASMYKTCMDYGATFYIAQGISDSNSGCFDEMRSYVESALMWDITKNYNDLAYDFMQHFYKDASEAMWEYYLEIRDRYAYYQTVVAPQSGNVGGDIANADLYSYEFVEKLADHIDNALAAIEPLQETNPEQYTLLKSRIKKEYLTVIYARMLLHKEFLTEEQISEMKVDWDFYINYFGITKCFEGGALDDIFA